MDGPAWRLFDRVAADYDQVAPFFAEYGAAIMDVLDPPAGCRFLDLGAGRGALTAPALERGCVVTAVDAAPAMVERLDALFGEFAAYLPPNGGMGRPVDAADLLEEAGFVDLREDHAGIAITFPDNAMLWRWACSHGYRAFIDDLPDDRRREFHDRVMELPAGDRVLPRATGIWSGRKPVSAGG